MDRLSGLRKPLVYAGLALAGLSAVVLASCSDGGDTSDEPVQLVYQDWRTDWFPPMAQQQLGSFHEEHPGLRVFYTPDPDNLEEVMVADMEAGTAPDVFQGCCSFFPIWAQEGYLLDLAPYITKDLDQGLISEWSAAQYAAFLTEDGRQYAVPKYHGGLALYYNKDLFDQYGVPYPDDSWDHDDYLDAMRRLTRDTNGDGANDLWGSMLDISWERIQVHVNGWGGHFVNPDDPMDCVMDEQPALDALQWLRDRMWEDDVMASFVDVQNLETRQAFIQGKVAMVEDGSWALKDILANANFRIGVAPFPSGPEKRVTLATTDGFAIYANTPHPDEAWELVKFLISEEYGIAMAEANFLQPARSSLVGEWAQAIRNQYPVKTAEMDLEAFADGHVRGYSVTAEVFPDMATAASLVHDAWDQILTLGTAPVEQIRQVCTQIEQSMRNSVS